MVKLKIDDLAVDSFVIGDGLAVRGTVAGHEESVRDTCIEGTCDPNGNYSGAFSCPDRTCASHHFSAACSGEGFTRICSDNSCFGAHTCLGAFTCEAQSA